MPFHELPGRLLIAACVLAPAAALAADSASWFEAERVADERGVQAAWESVAADSTALDAAAQIQRSRLLLALGGPAALREEAQHLAPAAAAVARLLAALELSDAAIGIEQHAAVERLRAEGFDHPLLALLDVQASIAFDGPGRIARADSLLARIESAQNPPYVAAHADFLRGFLLLHQGERDAGLARALAAAERVEAERFARAGASMRSQVARVLQQAGRVAEAGEQFRKALEVAGRTGDRRLFAISGSWLAYQHERAGRFRECYELERQTAPMLLQQGDLQGALYSHLSWGWAANHIGEYEESLRLYAQAMQLADRIDSAWGRAQARLNLGWAWLEGGEEEQAARSFEQGAMIARAAGNVAQEADLLNGSASAELRWGRPDLAAESYRRLADLHRQRQDEDRELIALANLALALRTLGENDAAISLQRDIYERNRARGQLQGMSDVNLANWLAWGGRIEEAERILGPILADTRSGDVRRRAEALAIRGRMSLWQEKYSEAARLLAEVDLIYRVRGDARPRMALLREIARAQWNLGDFAAGRATLDELETLTRELDPGSLPSVEADRACLELAAGDRPTALRLAREAARNLSLGATDSEPEAADARTAVYDRLINVAIEAAAELEGPARQEVVEESFGWLLRLKARSLWDCVRGSAQELRAQVGPDLMAAERAAYRRLESLKRQLQQAPPEAAERDSLESERLRAQAAWTSAHERLLAEDERFRLANHVLLPSLDEVRDLLLSDPGVVVLDFFISTLERGYPRRAALYVMNRDGLALQDLGAAEEFDAKLDLMLGLLEEVAPGADQRVLQRALDSAGELLLGDVAPAIEEASELILVPDGILASIPLAAVRWRDRYLVEHCPIQSVPSLAVLVGLRRRDPGQGARSATALAIWESNASNRDAVAAELRHGGPAEFPLRYAAFERELLLDGYRDAIWLGVAPDDFADRMALDPELTGAGVLHFIAHGYFDEKQPWRSALYLDPGLGSESRRLAARDVYRMDLSADHVTLSACETARVPGKRGRGLEGLAQSFFVAGARSILATNWAVDDRSTALLMHDFYDGLSAGLSRAEALRQAQLRLLAVPESSHPFYWAPFVLLGDGSQGLPLTRAGSPTWWGLALAALLLVAVIAWLASRRRKWL